MTVAVVTGAGRGIGRAIAARLAADGAAVVIADIDADSARTAAAGIAHSVARTLDVTDAQAFSDLVAEVEAELGPVGVLVNNAGIMPIGPFESHDAATDRRVFDVNVHGVLNGVRAVLPGMLARRSGHIVNISSTAGAATPPGGTVYAGSKHAVVGISDGLRLEFADRGISVSVILPSFTATELIAGTAGVRGMPTVTPEQVADVVAQALRRGSRAYFVPRWLRGSMSSRNILPTKVNDAVARISGASRVFLDFDRNARQAYDKRIEQG
ncbi:MAG: SDR family oxidoreductase [Mycobacteriaceae bacterium]|nr:SDR family oxidoreductase [Mycobacteriaceae bacterium]